MAPIVVVDDHAATRAVLTELFRGEGYAVVSAADGREALRYLQDGAASLILLDLDMPGMNGWDFLVAQNSDPRLAGIPVVVHSAQPGPVPGAVACITKPADTAELLDVVARHRDSTRDGSGAGTEGEREPVAGSTAEPARQV